MFKYSLLNRFYERKAAINLEQTLEDAWNLSESLLKKKGINSKEELRTKLIEFATKEGAADPIKALSSFATPDKFLTFMRQMIIEMQNVNIPETKQTMPLSEHSFNYVEIIKRIRHYIKPSIAQDTPEAIQYMKDMVISNLAGLYPKEDIETAFDGFIQLHKENSNQGRTPEDYEKWGLPITKYENLYDYINKNLSPLLPKERTEDFDSWRIKNERAINTILIAVQRYLGNSDPNKSNEEIEQEVIEAFEEFQQENWDKWISEEYPA